MKNETNPQWSPSFFSLKLGLILISTCVQGLMAWATSIRRCLERRHQEEAFCRRDSSRTLVTDPGPSSQPICPCLQQGSQSNVHLTTSLRKKIFRQIKANPSFDKHLVYSKSNPLHYCSVKVHLFTIKSVNIFVKWIFSVVHFWPASGNLLQTVVSFLFALIGIVPHFHVSI